MNKLKIHELAKELNVSSKRLMEKLEEIGIHPKSHMSTLEDDELERLYKHIGIVNRSKQDASDSSESEAKADRTETVSRKNAPRIIRKTEVVIHDDYYDEQKDKKKTDRRSFIRSSDSNDGLMAGYTRGRDSMITGIRKKKPEEIKPKAEEKKPEPIDIIESIHLVEKVKKPVDEVLSIKKVARVSDRVEAAEEQAETAAGQADAQPAGDAVSGKDTVKAPSEEAAEKTAKQDAETKTAAAAKEKPAKKQDEAAPAKESGEKAAQADHERAQRGDKPPLQKQDRQDKPEGADKAQHQEKRDGKPRADGEARPEGQRRSDGGIDRRAGTDFQRRPGGETGRQDRPQDQGRREGQRGDFRHRDGQPRGDFKPGEGRQFDRGAAGGRPYGDRAAGRPFGDKGSDGRFDGKGRGGDGRYPRRDDRGPRRDAPLVIPKAVAPAGATEEKVFTRGERREFQIVERKKEEKKEQKKEAARPAPGVVPDKGTRLKKKIDTVVGHKASVSDMMSDDFVIDVFYDDASEALKSKRAEKKLKRAKEKEKYIPPKAVLTDITIPESITVKDLAEALKKTVADVIKKLFLMGVTATQNQELDFDTAAIIADEYQVKVHKAVVVSEEDILFDDTADEEEDLEPRAPVVVVMGHVDHGKTSLLDAIRNAHIAEKEAGGITQHIGAYTVNLHGRDITFLDTPGHEAFTAMRARGAQVTDIAILVVAADDGVMPQTIEAINHAKAAGVAIIVAINKIDKPNANPDRVKQELTEHGILIEEWGGDVIAVPVSAKQNVNIDQLLEMVLLTADVLELKANRKKQAKGTVIEAQLDKNKGPVATLLVQRGVLKVGDAILTGTTFGRIRSMVNDKGRKIKEAGPSVPVEISGLSEVPEAGEIFYAVTDEKVAKQLVERRKEKIREKNIRGRAKISLEDLFSQIKEGTVKELNLIVKADVQGSVEAIRQSMEKLSNEEVKVKVIHGAVGAVTESDIMLAQVSNAIIIGFNVRPAANVAEAAQSAGVDMRLYRVIYDAIDDIEKAMKGMLKPTYKEVVDGHVEIRQIFKVSNIGTIGGSYVLDGKITRNSDIRLVRDGIVILEGKLSSLKRFKDDVREVAAGYECGLMIEKYNDIKEGDIIEAFHMEEVQRQ